jgi:transglutaminase-like putative cysteine protease
VVEPPELQIPEDGSIAGKIEAVMPPTFLPRYQVVAPAVHGTLELDSASGSFTYRPDHDFNGLDRASIGCRDGRQRAGTAEGLVLDPPPVTLTFVVTAINDPPVAEDQEALVDEDTALTGQIRATDPDGDALTYGVLLGARHGELSVDSATGQFTYRPARNYAGKDAFRWMVSDGHGASAAATVTVTVLPVDDPPVAGDQAATVPRDGLVVGTLWADDAEGDRLTYAIVVPPASGTLDFVPETRIFTYHPASGFVGEDSFQFTATDGEHTSAPGRVTIRVLPEGTTGPQVLTQHGRTTIAAGESATLDVTASGNSPLVFRWWKNGLPLGDAVAASYTTPPAGLDDNGASYAVTVYDNLSSMTSLSWTLDVVESRDGTRIFSLFSNQQDLLPKRLPLVVKTIARPQSGIGARVVLASDAAGLPSFQSTGTGSVQPDDTESAITVTFPDSGSPELQSTDVTIWSTGAPLTFALSYANAAWQVAHGRPGVGEVAFTRMGVPIASSQTQDWIIGQPTPADQDFAASTWGSVIAGLGSPTERAQALARALIDALEPHLGIPSDEMNSSDPFQQYQLAVSGRGQVWCGNIAAIFAWACKSLGIPARVLGMGSTLALGSDYTLQAAEGHTTTEIFDELANRWVWMDATLHILGVEREGLGLLSSVDAQHDLNDPMRVAALRTHEYDPTTGLEAVYDVGHSPQRASLRRFVGPYAQLAFPRNGRAINSEFYTNEAALFPRNEELAIKSLRPIPGDYGVLLLLGSALPDLEGFEYHETYSTEGDPDRTVRTSPDGAVAIRFANPHLAVGQAKQVAIRALRRSGATSAEAVVTAYFYSRELYAASGLTTPGQLIFDGGGLPIAPRSPSEWIVDLPSTEDVLFAEATWGASARLGATPTEKARAVAAELLDGIGSRQGIPYGPAPSTPFDLYRSAVAGLDLVDSSGMAEIFAHACNALGIPARIVRMGKVLSRGSDYELRAAPRHAAVEIFDGDANRWEWMDLSFGMLGADLRGYGLLNTAELRRALDDPAQVSALSLVWYDPTRGSAEGVQAGDPRANEVVQYFEMSPILRYAAEPWSGE